MVDTGWIIGYAASAESPSSGTWRDTRLGGHPLWPPGDHPNIEKCPFCNRERLLIIQAFAPHPLHAERVIMVFSCNSVLCSRKPQSWCALRAFCRNEQDVPKKQKKCEGAALACATDVVNWDTDSTDDEISNTSQGNEDGIRTVEELLALQHLHIPQEKPHLPGAKPGLGLGLSLKDGQSGNCAQSSTSSAFLKPHFVEVEIESKASVVTDDAEAVEKMLKAYRAEEAKLLKSGELSQWEAEKDIEETDASRAVEEFRIIIERAPGQVLRYKFGGDPIWPSHPAPEQQHICCPHCGAAQVFELQLLGSVLFYLKPESVVPSTQNEAALNFLAFGVYTCEKDCAMKVTEEDSSDSGGTAFEYRTQEVRLQHDVW